MFKSKKTIPLVMVLVLIKEHDMKNLIAVGAMSFLVFLARNSCRVLAESPNDKILNKLGKIQQTLDNQVIPKLEECPACSECPECPEVGVPQTGQTTLHRPGDDGALRKGVPWPEPRFTDNGDGTVTDNLTRWSKDSRGASFHERRGGSLLVEFFGSVQLRRQRLYYGCMRWRLNGLDLASQAWWRAGARTDEEDSPISCGAGGVLCGVKFQRSNLRVDKCTFFR